MDSVLRVLTVIWEFFVNNFLTQPAYFIGLMVVVGYILLKKPWYDVIAGFIKATIGFFYPTSWFRRIDQQLSSDLSRFER